MNDIAQPESEADLQAFVASHPLVLPVGNRSKPALSESSGATLVSLKGHSGIVEYEPSEFTFTARAGTAVSEVVAALGQRNQYLPFDPLLVDSGATLGGTVAAGLSGPGRARYGGIRDFLLGVRILSGDGETINAGGKVVKNAAGFDIPKLMVGSLGRLGVMTELTFKVFPKPPAHRTLSLRCESDAQAVDRMSAAASSRWELDAIDYRPANQSVYLRLGAADEVNDAIAADIQSRWGSDITTLSPSDAIEFWRGVQQLDWVSSQQTILKVPITPTMFLQLSERTKDQVGINLHLSAAGAVAWVSLESNDDLSRFAAALEQLGLSGLVLRGQTDSIWVGKRVESKMAAAIKQAMDPSNKFPALA